MVNVRERWGTGVLGRWEKTAEGNAPTDNAPKPAYPPGTSLRMRNHKLTRYERAKLKNGSAIRIIRAIRDSVQHHVNHYKFWQIFVSSAR